MILLSKSAPQTGHNKTPQPDAGFTLLEMTVVIAVMALVLLLITNYGRPDSHFLEEQATAQHIAQTMRAARGRAIAQGQPVPFILPRVPAWLAVSIQAPKGGIVFAPDGSASGGRVLLDGDGRTIMITADWLTGGVHIDAN
jgi:general secretion pathway protein H